MKSHPSVYRVNETNYSSYPCITTNFINIMGRTVNERGYSTDISAGTH